MFQLFCQQTGHFLWLHIFEIPASKISDCLIFGTFEDLQGGICDANICGLLWILDLEREDIGLFDVCPHATVACRPSFVAF